MQQDLLTVLCLSRIYEGGLARLAVCCLRSYTHGHELSLMTPSLPSQ